MESRIKDLKQRIKKARKLHEYWKCDILRHKINELTSQRNGRN